MDSFVVHTIPGSPYGRAVLIALEEKALPYRVAGIAPGAHRSPEHLARHPFGRVPVLDHGDFRLYETQAILRYVDRMAATPALTPPDVRAAARMDQLMNVNDWYLFQGVASVIAFQRVVGPKLMGIAPDEVAIEAAMPRARVVFDQLARELAGGPYFTGEDVTLADVLIAPQIDFFAGTPEWDRLTEHHAGLRQWLERMNARPSLKATTWERVTQLARAG